MKPLVPTVKQQVSIVTVDPETQTIQAALKDGGGISIAMWSPPTLFRWPTEGEVWTAQLVNNVWRLGELVQTKEQWAVTTSLSPGEAVIMADTVKDAQGRTFLVSGEESEPIWAPPIGTMMDYAGSGDPDEEGWLLCDGRELSRTTYATLFARIGTSGGEGDGTTTFNIPDARGVVFAGPDDMGTEQGAASRLTTNNELGDIAGAETHTLTIAQMPSHSHVIDGGASGAGGRAYGFGTDPIVATPSTRAEGGGGAHNNRQPTAIWNKIIRVL